MTAYFAVVGKVCTVLYYYRLKDVPGWLATFHYTWTALILAQVALALRARWQLRELWAAPATAARFDDPRGFAEAQRLRWRFRIAVAWGMIPLLLWIAFTPALGRDEVDWLEVFCLIVLHFLPLMLIDAVRYLLRQRRYDPAPVQAMRLAGIAGFLFPVVVLTSAWVLGTL